MFVLLYYNYMSVLLCYNSNTVLSLSVLLYYNYMHVLLYYNEMFDFWLYCKYMYTYSFYCQKIDTIDWNKYWTPKLYIRNSVTEMKDLTWRLVVCDENNEAYVYERRRLKAVFLENMELNEFPFDTQVRSYIVNCCCAIYCYSYGLVNLLSFRHQVVTNHQEYNRPHIRFFGHSISVGHSLTLGHSLSLYPSFYL